MSHWLSPHATNPQQRDEHSQTPIGRENTCQKKILEENIHRGNKTKDFRSTVVLGLKKQNKERLQYNVLKQNSLTYFEVPSNAKVRHRLKLPHELKLQYRLRLAWPNQCWINLPISVADYNTNINVRECSELAWENSYHFVHIVKALLQT